MCACVCVRARVCVVCYHRGSSGDQGGAGCVCACACVCLRVCTCVCVVCYHRGSSRGQGGAMSVCVHVCRMLTLWMKYSVATPELGVLSARLRWSFRRGGVCHSCVIHEETKAHSNSERSSSLRRMQLIEFSEPVLMAWGFPRAPSRPSSCPPGVPHPARAEAGPAEETDGEVEPPFL